MLTLLLASLHLCDLKDSSSTALDPTPYPSPQFRTLGLNIPYDFNDTDFSVSDDLLKTYLDSYEQTPWDALKYLVAGRFSSQVFNLFTVS